MSEQTIVVNGKRFRGYFKEADAIIRPDAELTVQAAFVVTHLEHYCIGCGWHGEVHLMGVFTSPADGLDYPYCLCWDCEDRMKHDLTR